MLKKTKTCAEKKVAAASRLLRPKATRLNTANTAKALRICDEMDADERLQLRLIKRLKETVSFQRKIIAEQRKRKSMLCDTIRLLRENNEEHLRVFAVLKDAWAQVPSRRQ